MFWLHGKLMDVDGRSQQHGKLTEGLQVARKLSEIDDKSFGGTES